MSATDEPVTFHAALNFEYDRERGAVDVIGEHVRDQIEVRARLVDDFLRQAVIIELERLGYTVTSPDPEA